MVNCSTMAIWKILIEYRILLWCSFLSDTFCSCMTSILHHFFLTLLLWQKIKNNWLAPFSIVFFVSTCFLLVGTVLMLNVAGLKHMRSLVWMLDMLPECFFSLHQYLYLKKLSPAGLISCTLFLYTQFELTDRKCKGNLIFCYWIIDLMDIC